MLSRSKRRLRFASYDQEEVAEHFDPPPPVVNLCQSLASSQLQRDTLRFVLHEKVLLMGTSPEDREMPVEIGRDCISLFKLLDCASRSPSPSTILSKDDCLPLAIIIASSLLQLHATPWLPEYWCTRSIYFAGQLNEQSVDMKCPYVTTKIGKPSRAPQAIVNFGYHKDLVALAIVLLELCEKKSICGWYERRFGTNLPTDIQGKAAAAWCWFEEDASEKMTSNYAIAFTSCLAPHTLGRFPPKRMTLTDESFREAVYRHIVLHLENDYDEYTRQITVSTLRSV